MVFRRISRVVVTGEAQGREASIEEEIQELKLIIIDNGLLKIMEMFSECVFFNFLNLWKKITNFVPLLVKIADVVLQLRVLYLIGP